jgi:hypothetical protein
LRTVLIANLVARAPAATVPHPIASVSASAPSLRICSSIVGLSRTHFLRTSFSTSTDAVVLGSAISSSSLALTEGS